MNSSSIFRKIAFDEFDIQFTNLINNKASFFGYFHGDHDESGKSWCSDCDIAKPIVKESSKVLEGQDNVSFIKFAIDRFPWRSPDYLYRVHPKVKLQKVPTLIYYQNGVEFGRLTEEELFDKTNVEDFIKQALE